MHLKTLAPLAICVMSFAQARAADQTMDEVFAQHEQQWITKPEFTSPLVDHLPASSTVPSPRDVLGDDIGAPRVLHYYADILKYYRALADKSPRVKIIPTGKTEEGRETVIVLISSEENIRNADANRQNLAKLADPRDYQPNSGARNHRAGQADLHVLPAACTAAETGPPEMLMELAYRLAVEESPLYQFIRKNVIVMLSAGRRTRWPRPLRRLVLQVTSWAKKARTTVAPVPLPIGASTFSTTTIATSITPGDHVQLLEVLPGMASADHARPA